MRADIGADLDADSVARQERAEEVDLGLRSLSVNVEKLGDHVPAQRAASVSKLAHIA